MSKADQLGNGRFGGGARPVSARRAAIGAATGVPTDGVAPPARLPVSRISLNPENPRTTLGDLTELAGSLKEHGQKQAITVMNRDAYVKANPSRADDLEADTTHVVVDGSSRLAAAREAGLAHLSVMVDDNQGSDGDAILESALVANIHRSDLDPLDEARALQRLLALHGSQVKLAKRLRKSQGWVSQRLALLNLSPELQAAVGEEPVELLRSVAKVPQENQQAVLAELKAERARKEAVRRTQSLPPGAPSESVERVIVPPRTGVDAQKPQSVAGNLREPEHLKETVSLPESRESAKSEDTDSVLPAQQPTTVVPPPHTPVPEKRSSRQGAEAGEGSSHDEPKPRQERPGEGAPAPLPVDTPPGDSPSGDLLEAKATQLFPYDDGSFAAAQLIQKMSDTEFDTMLQILQRHQKARLGLRSTAQ
ncbi:ParB/RepB/Spo0J family partition protein [Streptomyces sp. NPDC060184]|uniref:ParB/RepB/Spo0J family partition protein n=1 Tax=Streptomyces sp. NPDC060184 TaxID=3347064 RepID=UPI00365E0F9A